MIKENATILWIIIIAFGLGGIITITLQSSLGMEVISQKTLDNVCQEIHGPNYHFSEENEKQDYIRCLYKQPTNEDLTTSEKTVGLK